MKRRRLPIDRPWLVAAVTATAVIVAVVLLGNLGTVLTTTTLLCGGGHTTPIPLGGGRGGPHAKSVEKVPIQLRAILRYATTQDLPQQSSKEIRVVFNALFGLYPCNFLVFGLGHELMWASLNPGGMTVFLEEDPHWAKIVQQEEEDLFGPNVRIHAVQYKTHLYEARDLLGHSKLEPNCMPPKVHLKGNTKCRLILQDLPEEVYDRDWDVIMIDGPGGYLPDLPGRLAVIFTAAVMARLRTRPGVTHVILHDVNRRVEKVFAERFLCKKRLFKAVDRLWHFVIPPATTEEMKMSKTFFC